MRRVIHTGQALVDVVVEVPALPRRGQNVMASSPYTVSGLARALGISRQTLLDYSKRDEFLDTIEAARERCHEFAEKQL